VLSRHGFDEPLWTVEERAWLEAIAERASAGDGTLAARYGELFVKAQDALAPPDEAQVTVAQYAELMVAIERASEPNKELERRKRTVASVLRLDRRFRERAASDPELEREIEERFAAERAKPIERSADESDEPEGAPTTEGGP
jgi:hypothetical protein